MLICDRFSTYDSRYLNKVRQQKCLAQVFRDGIRLHRDVTTGGCTQEESAQQDEGLTLRLDALLNRAPLKSTANERLRLGILK